MKQIFKLNFCVNFLKTPKVQSSLISKFGWYSRVAKQPLPKNPVPQLEESLKKYLEYARVIAPSKAELEKTENLVENFLKTDGPKFQNKLLEMAKHESNWVNRFWLSDMYLNNRVALPINSNPAYIFPVQNFNATADFLNYAACLVRGVCDYKDLVDSRSITQDTSTGREKVGLCMEQYWRIFTSHRNPVHPFDELSLNTDEENGQNEHIIVMRKGQAFIAYTRFAGQRLSHSEVKYQLDRIMMMAENRPTTSITPIGVLTSAHRDKAAKAFQILNQDNMNRKALHWITSSAFVLCLDDCHNERNREISAEEALVSQGKQIMHGGGLKNGRNRWFDKTLQFIVCENGFCGLNIEHSVSEGIVIINLAEHALRYLQGNLQKFSIWSRQPPNRTFKPKPLTWHITNELSELVSEIEKDFEFLINDLNLEVLIYSSYGKDYAKWNKISPDAYIQLALQMAYYRNSRIKSFLELRAHGRLTSTYESASTRRFHHGRVDNIRAATPEALEWVKTMTNTSESVANKKKAFELAVKKQTQVMIENVSGYGIDNHLVGLRELSSEGKNGAAPIFRDALFSELFRFPLSTSQVATTVKDTYLCYGPVVPDGYGCAYGPTANEMLFAIGSYKSCSETDSKLFKNCIRDSLDEMKKFIDNLWIS